MSELIEINLNEIVYVKLTDVGKNELKRQWNQWNKAYLHGHQEYTPIKEDYQGFSKWQLHGLMSELGHLCVMGKDLPFGTMIKFNKGKNNEHN